MLCISVCIHFTYVVIFLKEELPGNMTDSNYQSFDNDDVADVDDVDELEEYAEVGNEDA